MSNKEQWTKPQLVVLAKGTPEESVLPHCKVIGNTANVTVPYASGQVGCDTPGNNNCGACQSRSGS